MEELAAVVHHWTAGSKKGAFFADKSTLSIHCKSSSNEINVAREHLRITKKSVMFSRIVCGQKPMDSRDIA